MHNASALVGNSSMGILEAPFYKLPVVNIGNRQQDRLNAGNVEFVDYNKDKIIKALEKACFSKKYKKIINNIKNPFGNGNASKIILSTLENIDLNDKKWYTKKTIAY